MFSSLSQNLGKIFDKLRGRGLLTEADIDVSMREIRLALLEADVAVPTIKHLIERIKEKAIGSEVIKSISPGQMIVKIVHDELAVLLGDENQGLSLNNNPPVVIMMVGLQGSGKTTSSAKLALYLRKKQKKKVLLASLDIYRPAAQLQLEALAKQIDAVSIDIVHNQLAQDITKRALKEATLGGYDVLILDTAGRLHTDEAMMQELQQVKEISSPTEILLVVDSMTGQDAVNIGRDFCHQLPLTGIILTRVDGDSRGGAALSMRHVAGVPIKFIGIGERVNELEEFHPQRAASRILGMGDIVSLVEKASEEIDSDEAEKMAKKLQKGSFDMDDLLKQLKSIQKMGGIGSMLGMIPGMTKMKQMVGNVSQSEGVLKRQEAIICSMTRKERRNPKIIDASRKRRIARGFGGEVQEVNRLLKQFLEMQTMIKKLGKMDSKQMGRMMNAFK